MIHLGLTKEQYFGMYMGQKVKNLFTENLIGNIVQINQRNNYLDLIPCEDTIEYHQYQSIVNDKEKYDREYFNRGDNLSTYSKYVDKYKSIPLENCQLILRTFEDITEEETAKANECFIKGNKTIVNSSNCACLTAYYISIGVDCFGLIEKGWAESK